MQLIEIKWLESLFDYGGMPTWGTESAGIRGLSTDSRGQWRLFESVFAEFVTEG